jgi:predicted  nucleic acid-binding Zn-ribbon protein
MATKTAAKLELVKPDLEQMEATILEAASQVAPMTSRAQLARNEIQLKVNGLIRERADFEDRRSLLKAQYEAADNGLAQQVADIDETLALYPQKGE